MTETNSTDPCPSPLFPRAHARPYDDSFLRRNSRIPGETVSQNGGGKVYASSSYAFDRIEAH